MQSAARHVLGKGHRISNCLRARARGATAVPVFRNSETGSTAYGQLQTCGLPWLCPVCAQKIMHQRREDLQTLIERHTAAGGGVYLMTRTIPHGSWDSLGPLLQKLSKAEMKFRMGKPWKRILSRYGIIGSVRAKEITVGMNGWHPHCHDLVLTAAPLSVLERVTLEEDLFTRWESSCSRAGFPALSRAAFSLQSGDRAAAYVSKFGIEHELTSYHVKRAKGLSVSPFDLLRVIVQGMGENAVREAETLFLDYARQTKGKRLLTWSKGLRQLYGLGVEKSDEETAEETDPRAAELGAFELHQWRRILAANRRAEILNAARPGDWSAVLAYLDTLPPLKPSERGQGQGAQRSERPAPVPPLPS